MSEHSVLKHTTRAYKLIRDPEMKWRKKIGGIVTEICIIVFAVSLTIYLEKWQEHVSEERQKREFLRGLLADLSGDLKEMRSDSASYYTCLNAYRYFLRPTAYTYDSMAVYSWTLYNTTDLYPNISRIETLKASGKLALFENEGLLNAIMDYYQEVIPALTEFCTNDVSRFKKEKLISFIDDNRRGEERTNYNYEELLREPRMLNYLNKIEFAIEYSVLPAYRKSIEANKKLQAWIEEELGINPN